MVEHLDPQTKGAWGFGKNLNGWQIGALGSMTALGGGVKKQQLSRDQILKYMSRLNPSSARV